MEAWFNRDPAPVSTSTPTYRIEYTPFGTPIYVDIGTNAVIAVGRRKESRLHRAIHRVTRYAALAASLYAGGYLSGFLLPVFTAPAVTGALALAGGIHTSKMVLADLTTLGLENKFLRGMIAGKAALGFALLPVVGHLAWGTSAVLDYLPRAVNRAVRRGMGSMGGNLWSMRSW